MTVEGAPAIEVIPGGDVVSKAIFEDSALTPPEMALQFQYDKVRDERAESVYWRKYAPAIADVHARGCSLQVAWATQGAVWKYTGARGALAQSIRAIKTQRGHSFDVIHCPQDGDLAHSHVAIVRASGPVKKLSSNDKLDLIDELLRCLGGREPHACP